MKQRLLTDSFYILILIKYGCCWDTIGTLEVTTLESEANENELKREQADSLLSHLPFYENGDDLSEELKKSETMAEILKDEAGDSRLLNDFLRSFLIMLILVLPFSCLFYMWTSYVDIEKLYESSGYKFSALCFCFFCNGFAANLILTMVIRYFCN